MERATQVHRRTRERDSKVKSNDGPEILDKGSGVGGIKTSSASLQGFLYRCIPQTALKQMCVQFQLQCLQ